MMAKVYSVACTIQPHSLFTHLIQQNASASSYGVIFWEKPYLDGSKKINHYFQINILELYSQSFSLVPQLLYNSIKPDVSAQIFIYNTAFTMGPSEFVNFKETILLLKC